MLANVVHMKPNDSDMIWDRQISTSQPHSKSSIIENLSSHVLGKAAAGINKRFGDHLLSGGLLEKEFATSK